MPYRRFAALGAALALAAALAPTAARAGHTCDSFVMFTNVPVGNPNGVMCLALGGDTDPVDFRILYPGSTVIQVRYTQDFGPDVPTLTATLDGLTFQNKVITLTRRFQEVGGFGLWVYDSAQHQIPGGRTAIGCVNIVLEQPDDEAATTSYRTIGGDEECMY